MPPTTMTDQPTYAQILLPPGLTLDQFYKVQKESNDVAKTVVAALAVAAWDYIVLFPQEVAVYRHFKTQRTWLSPPSFAFIFLRYSIFITLVSGLFFTSLQSQHCQVAASLSQAGFVISTASVGVIFCYRAISIWCKSRVVIGTVSVLYLGMIACWIVVVIWFRAHEGPPTEIGSNCLLSDFPLWSPINYMASVIFDVCILAFTIVKWMHGVNHGSRLWEQFLNDNIIYFIVVSVANIVVFVIQFLGPQYRLLKSLALPWPTLLNTAMGSRVYLNLKLYEVRRESCDTTTLDRMQFATNPAMRTIQAATTVELAESSDDTHDTSPEIST